MQTIITQSTLHKGRISRSLRHMFNITTTILKRTILSQDFLTSVVICYGLTLVVPLQSPPDSHQILMLKSNTQSNSAEVGLRRSKNHERSTLINGINPLKKDPEGTALHLLLCEDVARRSYFWRRQQASVICCPLLFAFPWAVSTTFLLLIKHPV